MVHAAAARRVVRRNDLDVRRGYEAGTVSGYDEAFFEAQKPIALSSALEMLPLVLGSIRPFPLKLVDVGCGVAAWAHVALTYCDEVRGVDQNTPADQLMIPPECYVEASLENGYDCTGFDIAVCLEVGEHLPKDAAEELVAGLVQAPWVLFSAAHPGQGGVDHVNEQWPTWWASLFEEHGYRGTQAFSRIFWDDERVADYYRENAVLYAHASTWADRDDDYLPELDVIDVIHPCRTGLWP